MSYRHDGFVGFLSLLELLFGGQARAAAVARKDTRDALAALKMPTPKLVMPPEKGTKAAPAAALEPKPGPSKKKPKSGWQV